MKKPFAIIAIIFSLTLTIFRVSRCMQRLDASQRAGAKRDYYEACQKKLDTAWMYFKPVAAALENNQPVSDAVLTTTTSNLYDVSHDVVQIAEYDDEGGYYKKYVTEFIEFERGLTCCYLRKYQEELLKNKKLSKGTYANLMSWLDRFPTYSAIYGEVTFNLYNRSDFSLFRAAVMAAAPLEPGNKTIP